MAYTLSLIQLRLDTLLEKNYEFVDEYFQLSLRLSLLILIMIDFILSFSSILQTKWYWRRITISFLSCWSTKSKENYILNLSTFSFCIHYLKEIRCEHFGKENFFFRIKPLYNSSVFYIEGHDCFKIILFCSN